MADGTWQVRASPQGTAFTVNAIVLIAVTWPVGPLALSFVPAVL
jgi:hypothetical protein